MRIKKLVFGGAGVGNKAGDLGLLILRLTSGGLMAYVHGLGKVKDPSGVIAGAGKLGFPVPTVFGWAAALSEFAGGILIAIGLLTRPSALFLGFTMAVAAFMRHAADPLAKKELALLYLGFCVLLVLTGAGRFSVDALLRKK